MELLDGDVLAGDSLAIGADLRAGQMTFERAAAKAVRR